MYVCAKFENDICIPSYFFRIITKKYHPRDNNWYLHRCPITDIYTAAHPYKYQLLSELLFFFKLFFWKYKKGDISREIFLVLPICHGNEQIMRFFSYHDEWHRYIIKPLLHCIWILFTRICFVFILTRR